MNLPLPAGPIAEAVGWALLHLLWQGALVAVLLAVLLVLIPRRSASARYLVSCAALALIVVLGTVTAIRTYPSSGGSKTGESAAAATQHTRLAVPSIASLAALSYAPERRDQLQALLRTANDALPLVVTFWLVGVTLFSVRLVLEWLRARRLVTRGATRAREQWQAAASRLASALGVRRAVRLLESAVVEVPSVVGLVRPVILLPASALTGLAPAQLEMILAHELAHIRRHDFLVNLLQAVVETLLFYHPAVWWISRQVRIERENCCDDLAVAVWGNPVQYARALSRLEELRAEAPAVAVSAAGGSLLDRIRRIAGKSAPSGPAARGAAALALLAGLLLAAAAPSVSAIGRRLPDGERPVFAFQSETAVAEPTSVARTANASTRTTRDATADASETPREATVAPSENPSAPAEVAASAAAEDSTDELESDDATPDSDDHAAPDADSDRPSLEDLIALRAQGVTVDWIREMRSLFPGVTLRDIASMKAVGVTGPFVRELRRVGLEVRTAGDAQGLAAVGVSPEFVRRMRDAGIEVRSAQDAQGLAAVGVSPDFVREMRDVGLDVKSAQDAQGLAAVGVSPDFVRGMRDVGLEVKSAQDAQGLAAVGVTPDYVREMRAAGLSVESASAAQSLRAVGVTARFIRGLQGVGIAIQSAEDAQGMAALGVTPDYVRQMRAAGVELTRPEDAKSLRAVGVTPELVRALAGAGYPHPSLDLLRRLGAGGLNSGFVREMSRYRSR